MTAQITPLRTHAESQLIDLFRTGGLALPGGDAITERRRGAFDLFTASGLPSRRNEAWHYTDLRALMRDALPFAMPPGATAAALAESGLDMSLLGDAVPLVLIDGFFMAAESGVRQLPAGVRIASLAASLDRPEIARHLEPIDIAAKDAALALNTMFMRDGIVIEIDAGAEVERPLCIVSLRTRGEATSAAARSLVLVGEGASVLITEVQFGGAGPSQTNDALQFVLGEGARVEHVVFQSLAQGALSLATLTADLAARASFDSLALTVGAQLSRRQLFVRLGGAHGRVGLAGVTLLAGEQHADTTLVVDHATPHGESRERFRHILGGESTGIFQGKVVVRPGAQKTDGGMKSNALLLSDSATMNNKPELEIFADDVVCGHGATCGSLDEEQLFYLMARGLPHADAEALLLEAFAAETLEQVSHAGLREALLVQVQKWLLHRPRSPANDRKTA
jgi:Fe-S cluster assembly protein SufD